MTRSATKSTAKKTAARKPAARKPAAEKQPATPSRPEHVDVLIIGAGLSGVGAAAQLGERHPDLSVAILEGRGASGGTWDLFRYPGIRSDSDMFTFGYKWRPWKSDTALADGELILEYIRTVAREYGVDEKIRYHHRVTRAAWSSDDERWTVTIDVSDPDRPDAAPVEKVITAGLVWSCAGYYRYEEGFTPEFPGLESFGGQVVHPQHWPEDLELTGKKVVVIGSGATAITIVPAIARDVEHVTMLQRTPTYVLSRPARDPLATLLKRVPGRVSDPVVRWSNILQQIVSYRLSQRFPDRARRFVTDQVRQQLPDVDVDTHFNPPYSPWEQRVCFVPDNDLFKAVRSGQASIETGAVQTFDEQGIVLTSGERIDADVVVTATGFNLLVPFGGVEVEIDGEKVAYSDQMAYKSLMISDVPNFVFTIGYTNASWTLKADLVIDYVDRLLGHMKKHGQTVAVPRREGDVGERPLMDLKSGYIQRSEHLLPSQGDRAPWRLDQNYLADRRYIQRARIDDGVLELT